MGSAEHDQWHSCRRSVVIGAVLQQLGVFSPFQQTIISIPIHFCDTCFPMRCLCALREISYSRPPTCRVLCLFLNHEYERPRASRSLPTYSPHMILHHTMHLSVSNACRRERTLRQPFQTSRTWPCSRAWALRILCSHSKKLLLFYRQANPPTL